MTERQHGGGIHTDFLPDISRNCAADARPVGGMGQGKKRDIFIAKLDWRAPDDLVSTLLLLRDQNQAVHMSFG